MSTLTIFFATDIHGSETCWRKFLNAGKAYRADVLIMGGDLTGKVIVPIYRTNGGWHTTWKDTLYKLETQADLDGLMGAIRAPGAYPYVTTQEEMQVIFGDPEAERQLFTRLKAEVLQQWMFLADERLAGKGIRCLSWLAMMILMNWMMF